MLEQPAAEVVQHHQAASLACPVEYRGGEAQDRLDRLLHLAALDIQVERRQIDLAVVQAQGLADVVTM